MRKQWKISQPISGQWSHFMPPKNTRKPLVFWCFHVVQNGNIVHKWVDVCSDSTNKTVKQYAGYVSRLARKIHDSALCIYTWILLWGLLRIIHLVRTQNFAKKQHFLPELARARIFAYQRVKDVSFLENFTNVQNGSFTIDIFKRSSIIVPLPSFWALNKF